MKTLKPKRNVEIFTAPQLKKCFWLSESHRSKNDEVLRKLLGKTKGTVAKPVRQKPMYYLADDNNAYLVLFCPISQTYPSLYAGRKWVDPKKWVNLFHQTAGFACHHHQMEAMFLEPTPRIVALMKRLVDHYDESCVSRPSLKSANEYECILKEFGVSAERSVFSLEEGFYPIDIDFLGKVTKSGFPKDLQELCKPPIKKRWACMRDFKLAILGPNCD